MSQYQDFTLTDDDADGNPFSVDFKILNITSPEDSVGSNAKIRTIQYEILFKDFGKAQMLLIGWPEYATESDDTPYISRHIPHSYIDPNGASLFCTSITRAIGMQPKSVTNGTDDPYELMHLTCKYEVLPYPIISDAELSTLEAHFEEMGTNVIHRYIEVGEVQSTGSIVKQPVSGYCYCHPQRAGETATASNSVLDNGTRYILDSNETPATGISIPSFEQLQELIWHHVPRDHAKLSGDAGLFAYQYKINSEPFWVWKTGTAMLDTIKPEYLQEVDGTYSWRIRFRIRINPFGFNFFPDPKNGNAYRRLARVGDPGLSVFQSADLNQIFIPGAGP